MKESVVYAPMLLMCVFLHKILVNIVGVGYNKMCLIVQTIRCLNLVLGNYWPQQDSLNQYGFARWKLGGTIALFNLKSYLYIVNVLCVVKPTLYKK